MKGMDHIVKKDGQYPGHKGGGVIYHYIPQICTRSLEVQHVGFDPRKPPHSLAPSDPGSLTSCASKERGVLYVSADSRS